MTKLHIDRLAYSHGYRYQVKLWDCACQSKIRLDEDIKADFYEILKCGVIVAKVGYAWNGANKPAVNTRTFVRPSLFHDIVRQAIADGLLDPEWCEEGDRLMRRIAVVDGMWRARRWWTFKAVRKHGKLIATRRAGSGDKKVTYIPKREIDDD